MVKQYGQLLRETRARLRPTEGELAAQTARELLAMASGKTVAALLTDQELYASEPIEARLGDLTARYLAGCPLAYLLGQWDFRGLTLTVTPDVLIPRDDTLAVTELAIERLQGREGPLRVLDLCTGSGCIAVSLKALGGYARVAAADISPEALEVAEKNAGTYPVEFRQSDMFAAFEPGRDMFDVIVSNPPYIPSEVIRGLEPEVRDHEPLGALDGKEDGLYFYRILAEQCGDFLNQGGSVYFETGHDQGAAVKTLLESHGFQDTKVIKDLAGMDRVVRGTWPGQIRK